MEAISGDASRNVITNDNLVLSQNSSSKYVDANHQIVDLDSNLADLSNLITEVKESSNDIREDVVERAKLLMSDPNWLNDGNLSKLSEKLLQVEDFES